LALGLIFGVLGELQVRLEGFGKLQDDLQASEKLQDDLQASDKLQDDLQTSNNLLAILQLSPPQFIRKNSRKSLENHTTKPKSHLYF
jgi:hypothetical protein